MAGLETYHGSDFLEFSEGGPVQSQVDFLPDQVGNVNLQPVSKRDSLMSINNFYAGFQERRKSINHCRHSSRASAGYYSTMDGLHSPVLSTSLEYDGNLSIESAPNAWNMHHSSFTYSNISPLLASMPRSQASCGSILDSTFIDDITSRRCFDDEHLNGMYNLASPQEQGVPFNQLPYQNSVRGPHTFLPDQLVYWDDALVNNTLCFLTTYKGKRCTQSDNHAWKKCVHSHGEKERRDPSKCTYTFSYCNSFNRDSREWECKLGNDCKFAHSKEEELYHPLRYKTLECKNWYRTLGSGIARKCDNFNCAFDHEDPSPIAKNDGLRSLLLMVTDLTDPLKNRDKRKLVLTKEGKLEFFKIVTGWPRTYSYDGEWGNATIPQAHHPRIYITLWLNCYFDNLKASDPVKYEGILMEDFFFSKAEVILDLLESSTNTTHPSSHQTNSPSSFPAMTG